MVLPSRAARISVTSRPAALALAVPIAISVLAVPSIEAVSPSAATTTPASSWTGPPPAAASKVIFTSIMAGTVSSAPVGSFFWVKVTLVPLALTSKSTSLAPTVSLPFAPLASLNASSRALARSSALYCFSSRVSSTSVSPMLTVSVSPALALMARVSNCTSNTVLPGVTPPSFRTVASPMGRPTSGSVIWAREEAPPPSRSPSSSLMPLKLAESAMRLISSFSALTSFWRFRRSTSSS